MTETERKAIIKELVKDGFTMEEAAAEADQILREMAEEEHDIPMTQSVVDELPVTPKDEEKPKKKTKKVKVKLEGEEAPKEKTARKRKTDEVDESGEVKEKKKKSAKKVKVIAPERPSTPMPTLPVVPTKSASTKEWLINAMASGMKSAGNIILVLAIVRTLTAKGANKGVVNGIYEATPTDPSTNAIKSFLD
jgi:outer membrane biosynthesis protein TonB